MTDQQNRPQTLLEAAKAMSRACDGTSRWDVAVNEFRAAIAREEALAASRTPWNDLRDRAQQAEASAAWHKAESERLSAELAKAIEFRSYAEEAANFGGKWRERAEKAEAELAAAKSHPMDGSDITVMLNRAGVPAWGKRLPQGMTTPERVQWMIDDWNRIKGYLTLAKEALGVKL